MSFKKGDKVISSTERIRPMRGIILEKVKDDTYKVCWEDGVISEASASNLQINTNPHFQV